MVFHVGRDGIPVPLPGTENIVWANALAFDQRGNLYITEAYSGSPPLYNGKGGIWRVPPGGEAELWLRDDLLTGIGGPANSLRHKHGRDGTWTGEDRGRRTRTAAAVTENLIGVE